MDQAVKVSTEEAAQLLEQGYKYLDVRTDEEFAEGHARGSINAPFMLKTAEGMQPNPDFLHVVKEKFPDADVKLVVGCRSGNRSSKACAALLQGGYINVKDHAEGYTGWVAAKLPRQKCFCV